MKELLTCALMFCAVGLCHAAKNMSGTAKPSEPAKLEAIVPTISWNKNLPADGE